MIKVGIDIGNSKISSIVCDFKVMAQKKFYPLLAILLVMYTKV